MHSWLHHINMLHALLCCCFLGRASSFLFSSTTAVGVKDILFLGFTSSAKLHVWHPTERAFCCHLLKREAQVSMGTLFDIYKQPGQF